MSQRLAARLRAAAQPLQSGKPTSSLAGNPLGGGLAAERLKWLAEPSCCGEAPFMPFGSYLAGLVSCRRPGNEAAIMPASSRQQG